MPGPQWFTDPQSPTQWRWWDGTQWTDHYAPRETPPVTQARAHVPSMRETPTPTVVLVAFRQLGQSDALARFSREHAYAYTWSLDDPPQIGQWITVPTYDGHKHAVIGAIGTPADAQGHTLKAVASLVSQAELDKMAAEKGEPPETHEWVNVTSVGGYQEVLDRKLPYAVQVELFPWERGNSVTARVDGQRVGELPASVATRLHPVLHARRKAGMPPVMVRGEARRGDYVPIYLAVNIPHRDKFAGWIACITPEGFTRPRPREEDVNLHALNKYEKALAALFGEHGVRTRGIEARIEWTTSPSGKYAGQPKGIVSLDGITFAELHASHPDKWRAIYDDHQMGTPGRLLVKFWKHEGRHGAFAVYKPPQPSKDQ
jgi:hypothetical protein